MTTTDFPKIDLEAVAKVGSRLKNGAWVLDAREGRFHDEGIVLGFHSGAGAHAVFCIWKVNRDEMTYLGDYYHNLGDAYAAFLERR